MNPTMPQINIFKKQYLKKGVYAGGKSRSEIDARGKKIYKLSSNENMLGSSPKALQAIRDHVDTLNEYCDRTDDRYRKALSKFYQHRLSPNQFVTDNSGVAMLELIVQAFLSPGLECIISNPAFGPYQMFSDKVPAKVIDIPLEAPDFRLNVAGILEQVNEKTRLVFLTSPNNPTGTHIPKSQLDDLIYQLPEHVVVVLDEVYYQYADAPDYTTAQRYVEEGRRVIGVNSFSKAYGLAGMRMGYAYSTEEIATYLQQFRRPFHINTLCMEAAMAALEDTEFIEATKSLIKTEKHFIQQHFDRIGIKYWPTQANFFLVKPPMLSADFEASMLKQGIMVRQAGNFGAPGCIRITIGTREANEALIKALKVVLEH